MSDLLVVGGVNVKEQIGALRAGVDIVVATPGILEPLVALLLELRVSLIETKNFKLFITILGKSEGNSHSLILNKFPCKYFVQLLC